MIDIAGYNPFAGSILEGYRSPFVHRTTCQADIGKVNVELTLGIVWHGLTRCVQCLFRKCKLEVLDRDHILYMCMNFNDTAKSVPEIWRKLRDISMGSRAIESTREARVIVLLGTARSSFRQ